MRSEAEVPLSGAPSFFTKVNLGSWHIRDDLLKNVVPKSPNRWKSVLEIQQWKNMEKSCPYTPGTMQRQFRSLDRPHTHSGVPGREEVDDGTERPLVNSGMTVFSPPKKGGFMG